MVETVHFQSVVSIPQISFKKHLSVCRMPLSWRDSLNVVGFGWFGFVVLVFFKISAQQHTAGTDLSSQKRAANLQHLSL